MPARAASEAWSETASPAANQRTLAVRDKGKSANDSASKRKRAGSDHHEATRANNRRRTVSPDGHDSDSDAFDPDQPLEERRRVQQGFRDLMRDVTDNADEYLKGDSTGLNETLQRANQLARSVRQTAEATIDSRLLVTTADLTYRKVTRMTQGSAAQGIDIDEFVSKCISYMKNGAGIREDDAPGLSSTQRMRRSTAGRRRTTGNDEAEEEEIGDEGDMLNWPHLGQYACLPAIRRPALMGFLVGPMSVEKKVRKITKRSAPFRATNLPETRPEIIDVQAVGGRKEADLTAMCAGILQRLTEVQEELQQTVGDLLGDDEDMSEEEQIQVMLAHGLRSTGGVDFMRFVVNPKSFGQTVENLFYVSFLIRDGKVKIELDEHELPAIAPVRAEDHQGRDDRRHGHGSAKHQAIWKMDMIMWREIIDAFDIKEGLIEHRHYEVNRGPGAKGWYG